MKEIARRRGCRGWNCAMCAFRTQDSVLRNGGRRCPVCVLDGTRTAYGLVCDLFLNRYETKRITQEDRT